MKLMVILFTSCIINFTIIQAGPSRSEAEEISKLIGAGDKKVLYNYLLSKEYSQMRNRKASAYAPGPANHGTLKDWPRKEVASAQNGGNTAGQVFESAYAPGPANHGTLKDWPRKEEASAQNGGNTAGQVFESPANNEKEIAGVESKKEKYVKELEQEQPRISDWFAKYQEGKVEADEALEKPAEDKILNDADNEAVEISNSVPGPDSAKQEAFLFSESLYNSSKNESKPQIESTELPPANDIEMANSVSTYNPLKKSVGADEELLHVENETEEERSKKVRDNFRQEVEKQRGLPRQQIRVTHAYQAPKQFQRFSHAGAQQTYRQNSYNRVNQQQANPSYKIISFSHPRPVAQRGDSNIAFENFKAYLEHKQQQENILRNQPRAQLANNYARQNQIQSIAARNYQEYELPRQRSQKRTGLAETASKAYEDVVGFFKKYIEPPEARRGQDVEYGSSERQQAPVPVIASHVVHSNPQHIQRKPVIPVVSSRVIHDNDHPSYQSQKIQYNSASQYNQHEPAVPPVSSRVIQNIGHPSYQAKTYNAAAPQVSSQDRLLEDCQIKLKVHKIPYSRLSEACKVILNRAEPGRTRPNAVFRKRVKMMPQSLRHQTQQRPQLRRMYKYSNTEHVV